jgi:hypothetical protein
MWAGWQAVVLLLGATAATTPPPPLLLRPAAACTPPAAANGRVDGCSAAQLSHSCPHLCQHTPRGCLERGWLRTRAAREEARARECTTAEGSGSEFACSSPPRALIGVPTAPPSPLYLTGATTGCAEAEATRPNQMQSATTRKLLGLVRLASRPLAGEACSASTISGATGSSGLRGLLSGSMRPGTALRGLMSRAADDVPRDPSKQVQCGVLRARGGRGTWGNLSHQPALESIATRSGSGSRGPTTQRRAKPPRASIANAA